MRKPTTKLHTRWAQQTVGARSKFDRRNRLNYDIAAIIYDRWAAKYDGFRTPAIAIDELVALEDFSPVIWEPANGLGDISNALKASGFDVTTSDIFRWSWSTQVKKSFFDFDSSPNGADIITNPPFKLANKFVLHALNILPEGGKLALLLRTQFLEGGKRHADIYAKTPPKTIYVFSYRLPRMHRFGFKGKKSTASILSFAWFIWEKGVKTDTVVKWIAKLPTPKRSTPTCLAPNQIPLIKPSLRSKSLNFPKASKGFRNR